MTNLKSLPINYINNGNVDGDDDNDDEDDDDGRIFGVYYFYVQDRSPWIKSMF